MGVAMAGLLKRFSVRFHDFVTPRRHAHGMSQTIPGRRFTGKRRAPKAVEGRRVCAEKGCDTVLSRYNRKNHCHVHAPTKFPRVRGREAPTPG
jgi:hypothetical protein